MALMSSFLAFPSSGAKAHEIEPAIADFTIEEGQVAMALRWTIEAPLANLDFRGITNTNDASGADVYDEFRALAPAALNEAFRESWPQIATNITLLAGETRLSPEITLIEIPELGNFELARTSVLYLEAELPEGAETIQFGWTPAYGALVVRQMGIEDGYTGFLVNGDLTDPIPISGNFNETAMGAFGSFVLVGFYHIIPLGLDHILFVLGLFFLAARLKPLLWQVTAFTLAHTVTLALGATGVIDFGENIWIVEALIAASIIYVGIENVLTKELKPWRPAIIFAFGLLHGFGFASVLQDFGLGESYFVPKLIGFNLGVEIGQLAVIAAAWIALGMWFAKESWYKARLAAPVSIGIAVIAFFWLLERTGVVGADGIWAPISAIAEGELAVWPAAITAGAIIAVATVLGILSEGARNVAGFATSFAGFIAVTATFTAGAYPVMIGLVILWVVALLAQTHVRPESGAAQEA